MTSVCPVPKAQVCVCQGGEANFLLIFPPSFLSLFLYDFPLHLPWYVLSSLFIICSLARAPARVSVLFVNRIVRKVKEETRFRHHLVIAQNSRSSLCVYVPPFNWKREMSRVPEYITMWIE
jgi:hypothetical protein